VDEINARTAFRNLVRTNHFMKIHADFRAGVRHGKANDDRVFLQAAPVALVREGFPPGDAHGGEDAPAADAPGLAGGMAHCLNKEKGLVVENERVNHSCASISRTKTLL